MKCPSCGLDIPDDSEICPYCTARIKKRIQIKTIYIIAITLALVSSGYLALAMVASEVEVVKISSLGINDNYNFVHVRGVVVDYPRTYDTSYGVTQISFTINDGTGDLTVKIYRDLVNAAVSQGKVPGIGDAVDVQGTFSYGTRKSIIVNNIEFLHVDRVSFKDVPSQKIAHGSPWDFHDGEAITTQGNITGIREYSFGYIATLDDSVDVLLPMAYSSLHMISTRDLGAGLIRIYGTMKYYQPVSPSDDYKVVEPTELINSPEKYNNTNVRIPWAEILEKDENKGIIKVNYNGTNITIYSSRGVSYYDPGEHVEVQGKFINYHGIWEISVTRKNDFITEPRWEVIMHPQMELIEKKEYEKNNLTLYSFVELRGIVADYRDLSYGYLLTLWDGNRSYQIYIENRGSVIGKIDYGTNVVIKGMVTQYHGDLEIKVRAYTSDSVEVVS